MRRAKIISDNMKAIASLQEKTLIAFLNDEISAGQTAEDLKVFNLMARTQRKAESIVRSCLPPRKKEE